MTATLSAVPAAAPFPITACTFQPPVSFDLQDTLDLTENHDSRTFQDFPGPGCPRICLVKVTQASLYVPVKDVQVKRT